MMLHMRSYRQFCGLAKALDVVGDRWTLLIVRELLIRGACRYTDLRNGLPGIATNLLAERLKELETTGVIKREDAPPPVAATLISLTPRGQALEPVVRELGRWGAPLLRKSARTDRFRTHWLALCAQNCLRDHDPNRPRVTMELRSGHESITIEAAKGSIRTRVGSVEHPDAVLAGPPTALVAILTGSMDLRKGRDAGLQYKGDPNVIGRLQPRAVGPGQVPHW